MGKQSVTPPRRERDIQTEILRFLALVPGVVAWKSGAGAFRATYGNRERFVRIGKRGVSDIIGWYRTYTQVKMARIGEPPWIHGVDERTRKPLPTAQFLAVEVKNPGRKPTPEQAAFLELVRRDGGIAIVATCVDDVRRGLGLSSHP